MSIESTLERFDSFRGAEIKSLYIPTPTDIEITLHVQDKARDFDWIKLTLSFKGIEDARLIEESKLKYLSLEEGASLFKAGQLFAFGVGQYSNVDNIRDSSLFVLAQSLQIEENSI